MLFFEKVIKSLLVVNKNRVRITSTKDLCRDEVISKYSSYAKLVEALNSMRFIELIDSDSGMKFYIYKGVQHDYIVSPCRMCTCKDFIVNFIGRKREYPCYHVVGFFIAIKENKIYRLYVTSDKIIDIITEILYQGYSQTLRKLFKKSS